MTITARNLTLALAAAIVVSACQSTNKPPRGADNETLVTGRLAEANPLDVVVLPIENATDRTELPLHVLRAELQEGLVRLRYSPLALEYVDARVAEAGYEPGSMEEQAVFRVVLTGWEDSMLAKAGRVTIQADVHLLDAQAGTAGEPLWGGSVQREIHLSRERRTHPTSRDLAETVLREFALDVLASLPPRDPRR